jgi:predicted nucleic acid-binding Zn ribbon protein
VSRARSGEPRTIRSTLPRVLGELGLEGAASALRILECWEQAVGPEVAQHARPTLLRGEVLEASVDSSVWCQQIQLRRPAILAALRELLGPDAPRDLRLRVG